MPYFPQYMNAQNVEFATYTSLTAATHTAVNGELVAFSGTASTTVTLPAASLGGPVAVVNLVGTYTITVKTVEGTNHIQGALGSTGYVVPAGGTGASATHATFVSNGTDWFCVS